MKLLVEAFHDDPLYCYLLPDPVVRRRFSTAMHRTMVEVALSAGPIYATSGDLEGIFYFTPPGRRRRSAALMSAGLRGLCRILGTFVTLPMGQTWSRARRMFRGAQRSGMREYSNSHDGMMRLHALVVAPEHRGRGLAGRMVRAVTAVADAEGTPCLLDTENPQNVHMYEHLGFRLDARFEAVPGELAFHFMVYEPARESRANGGRSLRQ